MLETLDHLLVLYVAQTRRAPNMVEVGLEVLPDVERWLAIRGLAWLELYGAFEIPEGEVRFGTIDPVAETDTEEESWS